MVLVQVTEVDWDQGTPGTAGLPAQKRRRKVPRDALHPEAPAVPGPSRARAPRATRAHLGKIHFAVAGIVIPVLDDDLSVMFNPPLPA